MKNRLEFAKNNCYGCTTCAVSCPTKAISIVENATGFFEPKVESDTCIDCGKCESICPVLSEYNTNKEHDYYACWNTNDNKRMESSSGGVFLGLAERILAEEGIVFGARYNENYDGVYHSSTDDTPLNKLTKSKYVVSDLTTTFEQILKIAPTRRKILFVGTPCQCAGLHALTKEYDNVYLVDFVCGGSPSAKAFREYVHEKIKKSKSPIAKLDFRKKDNGWTKQYLDIVYTNGKKEKTYYLHDKYYSLFCMEHLITRNVCDTCKFRNNHVSDITIADFWGYYKTKIKKDQKGISLVSINTNKGGELFGKFTEKKIVILNYNDVEYAFQEFNYSQEHIMKKEKFQQELSTSNFNSIASRYINTSRLAVLSKRIKSKVSGK